MKRSTAANVSELLHRTRIANALMLTRSEADGKYEELEDVHSTFCQGVNACNIQGGLSSRTHGAGIDPADTEEKTNSMYHKSRGHARQVALEVKHLDFDGFR